jgi:hypothetical protein
VRGEGVSGKRLIVAHVEPDRCLIRLRQRQRHLAADALALGVADHDLLEPVDHLVVVERLAIVE